jgi:hypothetical protein
MCCCAFCMLVAHRIKNNVRQRQSITEGQGRGRSADRAEPAHCVAAMSASRQEPQREGRCTVGMMSR